MITPLPAGFFDIPFAHRALHGVAGAENSIGAVKAAVTAGWAIEIDIQPSADGIAMVFHDDALDRLTHETGPITAQTAQALGTIALRNGGGTVPTLAEVLNIVAGKVPLLIEIKDQDGQMGRNLTGLEEALAQDLAAYQGSVAVMSFNPHSVAKMANLAPNVPRGIVTSAYTAADWPALNADVRDHLARIPDFDRTGSSFISHERAALNMPEVAALKARGIPVCCWTVRSAEQQAIARQIADQITFEGYTPA